MHHLGSFNPKYKLNRQEGDWLPGERITRKSHSPLRNNPNDIAVSDNT